MAEEENKQNTRPQYRQNQRGFDRRRSKSPASWQGDSTQKDNSTSAADTGRTQQRTANLPSAPRIQSQKQQTHPHKNQKVSQPQPGRETP